MNNFIKQVIEEKFASKAQQRFFFAQAGKGGKKGKKWAKWAKEFSDKTDYDKMINGWFTTEMPDVNQENPWVEKYLTQNAIWSVETYGIDAFRIDTYKYCNVEVMNRINQALINEYPKIFAFGECWVDGVASQAYFASGLNFYRPFISIMVAAQAALRQMQHEPRGATATSGNPAAGPAHQHRGVAATVQQDQHLFAALDTLAHGFQQRGAEHGMAQLVVHVHAAHGGQGCLPNAVVHG